MKSKELAEIILKNPEAEVTVSVSDSDIHIYAKDIIEVTNQGENQITIVMDIQSK